MEHNELTDGSSLSSLLYILYDELGLWWKRLETN